MRAYLILALRWAITLTLSYCVYITTNNAYLPIAILWIMWWQEAHASLIGRMIGVQEAQSACINVLATERIEKDTEAIEAMIDKLIDIWGDEYKGGEG
jgi:hypothetical protein